jgi:hypothetical protein
MSQSDYIKYKKTAVELKRQSAFSPVLASADYTLYKQFQVENTVVNTAARYNTVNAFGVRSVFDIERADASGCSTFLLCRGTDERPNRVPLSTVYYTPHCPATFVKERGTNRCAVPCYNKRGKSGTLNINRGAFANRRLNEILCCYDVSYGGEFGGLR